MNLRTRCWNCGEPGRCERCGSQELRAGRGDCAECHRRRERNRRANPKDFDLTPAMRAYLAAFDAWLKEPTTTHASARAEALERLEGNR